MALDLETRQQLIETVRRFVVGNAAVLLRQNRITDPQHAVLHAEDEHRQQRRLFVAGRQRRHGEGRGQLALEGVAFPEPARRIHEGLEGAGDTAQVGG